MYRHILLKLREKVRTRLYIMTLHAEDEMEVDGLSIFDIESCIFTGQIVSRQKDSVTGEWKYVIQGQALAGVSISVIGKISATGKLVVITVYRE